MSDNNANIALRFLYNTKPGRTILKVMILPGFSIVIGRFLNSRFSKPFIKSFIKKNKINTHEYEDREYSSYNDYFKRKLKKGIRTLDVNPDSFISPCDSSLLVYPIYLNGQYKIKNSKYTIKDLLRDEELANEYEGGYMMVFRLAVDNYHRYCFIDNGYVNDSTFINGVLHTVQPIAFNSCNVFSENCREYCTIETQNFGKIVQCEVGAMIVGRISNHRIIGDVKKGQEKGNFEFGGSTIIVLVKKDKIAIRDDIANNSLCNVETKVKIGEKIAQKLWHEFICMI